MLALLTGGLPCEICGACVCTDFKPWLIWLSGIAQGSLQLVEAGLSGIFSNEIPESPSLFDEMLGFATAADHPVKSGESSESVFCFDFDADCIDADFKRFYGVDLSESSMHWHIFKARLNNLPPDSACAERQRLRAARPEDADAKSRAELMRVRAAYRLPQRCDGQKQLALKQADEIFYNS